MAANAAHEDDETTSTPSLPPPPPPPPTTRPTHRRRCPRYKSSYPNHHRNLRSNFPPTHPILISPPVSQSPPSQSFTAQPHHRRNPTQSPLPPIPPPFPWATDQRATVHSFEHLIQNQIFSISGSVQCKRCHRNYEIEFDLHEKFFQVANFIFENKSSMHDRAPSVWMNPVLPSCRFCQQENSMKPVMAEKKKNINWLFLLLGQMLGCCSLEQLKYFCKHTGNHRSGAKDRVLYLTYLALCKQVHPNGPFEYRE